MSNDTSETPTPKQKSEPTATDSIKALPTNKTHTANGRRRAPTKRTG